MSRNASICRLWSWKAPLVAVAGLVLLVAPVLLLAGQHNSQRGQGDQRRQKDIVDTAAANESFSILVAAIEAAELVDALKGKGPFTVFAPTNEAFEALPEGTLESLLEPENKEALQSILTYHVVAGRYPSPRLINTQPTLTTLQGGELKVSVEDGTVTVGTATVTATDVRATNGVIHVIDSVLLPPAGEE